MSNFWRKVRNKEWRGTEEHSKIIAEIFEDNDENITLGEPEFKHRIFCEDCGSLEFESDLKDAKHWARKHNKKGCN